MGWLLRLGRRRPAGGLPGWGVCPEFRASLTDRRPNSSLDGWQPCCRPASLRAVSVLRTFTLLGSKLGVVVCYLI